MADWQFSETLGSRKCLFVWFQWWVACFTRCVDLFNSLHVSQWFPHISIHVTPMIGGIDYSYDVRMFLNGC